MSSSRPPRIEDRRTAKLGEIGRQLKLPGFRPGKVPDRVLRQRYGTAVMAEVLEDSVNEATQQVLSERGPARGDPAEGRRQVPARGRRRRLRTWRSASRSSSYPTSRRRTSLPDLAHPVEGRALRPMQVRASALADIASPGRRCLTAGGRGPPGRGKGETLMVDYTGRIDGDRLPRRRWHGCRYRGGGPELHPRLHRAARGHVSPGETQARSTSRSRPITAPKTWPAKTAQFEIVAKTLKTASLPEIDAMRWRRRSASTRSKTCKVGDQPPDAARVRRHEPACA